MKQIHHSLLYWKRISILIGLIFSGLFFCNGVLAQFITVNQSDTIFNYSDSIRFFIQNQKGTVQWQSSINLEDWSDIQGEDNESLLVLIDSSAYYRAKIVDGTCDPVFSDTSKVIKYFSNEEIDSLEALGNLDVNRILLDTTDISYEIVNIDSSSFEYPVYSLLTQNDISFINIGDIIIDNRDHNQAYLVLEMHESSGKKAAGENTIISIPSGINFLSPNEYFITTPSNRTKRTSGYPNKLDADPVSLELSEEVPEPIVVYPRNMGKSFNDTALYFTFENTPLEDLGEGDLSVVINNGSIEYFPAFDIHFLTKSKFLNDISLLQGVTPALSGPSFGSEIEDFDIITYHDLDFNLDVTISSHVDIAKTIPFQLASAWYVIPMGQALFATLKLELTAYLTLDLLADANLNFNATSENDFLLGTEKNMKTGERTKFADFRTNSSLNVENAFGSVQYGAKIEVIPKIEIYYLGFFGYSANLVTGLDYRGGWTHIDGNNLWDRKLNFLAEANASLDLSFFHDDDWTAELDHITIPIRSETLFESPASVEAVSQNNLSGTQYTQLQDPIVVRVTDSREMPVENVSVFFDVNEGDVTLNNPVSITDENGLAQVQVTLGDDPISFIHCYIKDSQNEVLNRIIQFTVSTNESFPPTVTTNAPLDVSTNSARVGGVITDDGGLQITEKGVYWGTLQNPETTGSKESMGDGASSFSGVLTGLSPDETYYVQAFATNSMGTAVGQQVSFITDDEVDFATVVTYSVTNVETTSANSGGAITSTGGALILMKGVCWSTSQNPETDNPAMYTTDGSGSDSFTSDITGLTPGTLYYVRAYAINSVGTAYGNQRSFTTDPPATAPTVRTNPVINVSTTSANSGGNVTDNGGAAVMVRGVCWSTSQNPTADDNVTTNGEGLGSYSSYMSDLIPGTTYYVRAYAFNGVDFGYGQQRSFITDEDFQTGSFIDERDGHEYSWAQFGDQIWMTENLAYLPYITTTSTASYTQPSIYVYDYVGDNVSEAQSTSNYETYGALYNWQASRQVCPSGWHLPSSDEWGDLVDHIQINDNLSDFQPVLSGAYEYTTVFRFYFMGVFGYWWNNAGSTYSAEVSRYVNSSNTLHIAGYLPSRYGYSVRCVQD